MTIQQPLKEIVRQNIDDQSQDSPKSLANEATNEDTNEVANKAIDETNLRQRNERTAHCSAEKLESGSVHINNEDNEDNDPDENQDLDYENNNQQIVVDDSDTGVIDEATRREVYTDPDGQQYDVKIEYLHPSDEKSDVKVVRVTEQEQSRVLDNGEEESQESGGKSPGNEKLGFFGSVRNLVSDFADNIVKDFQEEENQNGGFTLVLKRAYSGFCTSILLITLGDSMI